jgi:hypothetical protein
MNEDTVDQLITILGAMFHKAREHAAKLRALEQVARDHPEIFAEYETYYSEIRTDREFQRSHDHTVEAIDRLRTALRQE